MKTEAWTSVYPSPEGVRETLAQLGAHEKTAQSPSFHLKDDFPGGSDSKVSAYNAGDPGWENLLEKEMATHSSILAWKIPWMEEPGRLQSMGSQRMGHN